MIDLFSMIDNGRRYLIRDLAILTIGGYSAAACSSGVIPTSPTEIPPTPTFPFNLHERTAGEQLPYTSEQLMEGIRNGTLATDHIAYYSLYGGRSDQEVQLSQLLKDDLAHPGKKEALIYASDNIIDASNRVPSWVQGIHPANTSALTVTIVEEIVKEGEEKKYTRKFVGIAKGGFSELEIPVCDTTFGCKDEDVKKFLDGELQRIQQYTTDPKALQ